MVWLAILALAFGLIFAVGFKLSGSGGSKAFFGMAGVLTLLAFIVCLALALFVAVPAGHVGVPVLFGKVGKTQMAEGLHLKNPFANVEFLSIRTETYTMSATSTRQADKGTSLLGSSRGVRFDDAIRVISSDGLQMTLDATINYRLDPQDAPWVYRNLGLNYVDKIVRPAARTAIREAAANFTSQEAYSSRRDQLAGEMQAKLVTKIDELLKQYKGFTGRGFVIQQVLLRNVDLPPTVKQAIERKLGDEQEALRMQFVIQREEREAERKRIEAKGIADFQNIVSKDISDPLLRWKGIEATMKIAESNNAKVVIIGGGDDGLPLILNTDGQ